MFLVAGICAAIGLSMKLNAAALQDTKLCHSAFVALLF
jgi:hypothetical protein